MSWAEREHDEPLEDWMLRLQISHAVIASRPAPLPVPGLAFAVVAGEPAGWVVFRHYLPDSYSASGGPS